MGPFNSSSTQVIVVSSFPLTASINGELQAFLLLIFGFAPLAMRDLIMEMSPMVAARARGN